MGGAAFSAGGAADGAAPERRPGGPAAGLIDGTCVLTADGEIPLQFLTVGDRLITRARGYTPITAIRCFQVQLPLMALQAGALAEAQPQRQILLPEQQLLHLRGALARKLLQRSQGLVPAAALSRLPAEGGIRRLGPQRCKIFEIVTPAPQVFYAEGLALCTPDTQA